ncbi:MAG: di-trans,poly-cis-decaprenylcistransferase [Acholeplasmatales bacterium]|jgi:undecaprenyl diphosphate synthase|nr:di-trans,poly-cis-decaprenylcistransferase [Acholeplasmatales bacterium]
MDKKITLPNHIGIIMDGNGRWAASKGLKRNFGHYFGGLNIAKIASYAEKLKIKELSLFAFSTENWKRPKEEIEFIFREPLEYLDNTRLKKIYESNIQIHFIGRKTKLPKELLDLTVTIENNTSSNTGLILNILLDYGSEYEILNAINNIIASKEKEIDKNIFSKYLLVKEPLDLLIRTGKEQRLSNFLLYQASYAEIYFSKKYWPSFSAKDFKKCINFYSKKQRRFGGL